MAQRGSGYKRRRADLYQTPAWVVADGLCHHFPVAGLTVLDPCAGPGKMVRALKACGAAEVYASDIHNHARHYTIRGRGRERFAQVDFIEAPLGAFLPFDILTMNPPYGPGGRTAEAFIRRGLKLLEINARHTSRRILMATLLSADFDSSAPRAPLFEGSPYFHARIILRRRIEWFKRPPNSSGPSANHCWFIWSSNAADDVRPPPHVFYAPAIGVGQ